ncbi:hypothetical protein [Thermococcus sp.]
MKISMERFVWNLVEDILVDQETDWSCVSNATRMALRYFGYDIPERKIAEFMDKLGYKVIIGDGEFLVTFPHAALFLKYAGFDVTYRTTLIKRYPLSADIIKDQGLVREILLDDLREAEDSYTRDRYKALLELMKLGGKVYLHQPDRMIQKKDILKAIKAGKVVIADVTARQYYGVDEDWGHALTLVPYGSSFKVLDGFTRKGYFDPDLRDIWDEALEKAKRFEWKDIVRIIEMSGD